MIMIEEITATVRKIEKQYLAQYIFPSICSCNKEPIDLTYLELEYHENGEYSAGVTSVKANGVVIFS